MNSGPYMVVIPETRYINDMSSVITLAFCLEAFSRWWHREENPRQTRVVLLNRGGRLEFREAEAVWKLRAEFCRGRRDVEKEPEIYLRFP